MDNIMNNIKHKAHFSFNRKAAGMVSIQGTGLNPVNSDGKGAVLSPRDSVFFIKKNGL